MIQVSYAAWWVEHIALDAYPADTIDARIAGRGGTHDRSQADLPEVTVVPVKEPAKRAPSRGAAAKQAAADEAAAPAAPVAPAAPLAVRENESPWSAEELDDVKSELSAELERIQGEVNTLQTTIADVLRDSGDGAGDDQADSGSKAFEREQEMTLLANTRETLFQTRHALDRIANGSYGTCESCGNPIGKMRLQAFPRATLCVSCKQRQERR